MIPKGKKGELKRIKREEPDEVAESAKVVFKGDTRYEQIEAELVTTAGIKMFTNDTVDSEYLQLPPHLDDEQSKELGRYLHTFTQQKIWVRTFMSRVGAMLREKEDEFAPIKDRVFSSQDKKMSVTEKELKLSVDLEAMEKIEELQFLQEKYNMLSDYMDNLVDGIFSISREISRREGDFKDQGRVDNVNNKRRN